MISGPMLSVASYRKERISCGTPSGSHSLAPGPITVPALIASNNDPDCPGSRDLLSRKTA
jgi:hypothetical protein